MAWNCCIVPSGMVTAPGDTVSETIAGAPTVSVVAAVTVPCVALIVVVPVPALVATPDVLMIATVADELAHCTVPLTS